MKVIITDSVDEMAREAAGRIAAVIKEKPNPVLGLATGSTPIPVYNELIKLHKDEGLDFSTVITFNLDEYVGLAPDDKHSYHYFMKENFFRHININEKNTHVPDGTASDLEAECSRYENMIDDVGGIDMQLLGIGHNGHIGFNEPGSSLASLTRVKNLSEDTIEANKQYFKDLGWMPNKAITMGIGSIMKAEKVLLIAQGKNKADAIASALEGPVLSMVPASVLQQHRFATYVITREAALKLKLSYYDDTE